MQKLNVEFTGYEPRQVLSHKLDLVVKAIQELQDKVAKPEAPEPVKKTGKTIKTEE